MREIKITTLIRKSIDRAELVLFRPFDVRKWVGLLVIAILAGSLGGGGGFDLPLGLPGAPPQQAPTEEGLTQTEDRIDQAGEIETETQTPSVSETEAESPEEAVAETTPGADQGSPFAFEGPLLPNPFLLILIIAVAIGLAILLMWLNCRFRFVWLHSVLENIAAIKMPFSKFKHEGNTLFKALLLITTAALLYAALTVGTFLLFVNLSGGIAEALSWNFTTVVALSLLVLLQGLPAIALVLFYVAVEDFVIPIMAQEPGGFRDSCGRFLEVYAENKKDFWIYLAVKIGLGIASALLQIMLLIGWGLLLIAVGAVVFGIPYLLFSVLIKLDFLFWIFAVVLGIPFFIAFFLLFLALGLPFAVFFRCFSLYFLSSLKTKYVPLPLE